MTEVAVLPKARVEMALQSKSQLHSTLQNKFDRLCAALSTHLLIVSLSFKIKILMTVRINSCSYEPLSRKANQTRQFIMKVYFQLKTIQLNIQFEFNYLHSQDSTASFSHYRISVERSSYTIFQFFLRCERNNRARCQHFSWSN